MYSIEEKTIHCMTCEVKCDPIHAQFRCDSLDCNGFLTFADTDDDLQEKGKQVLQKFLSKLTDERPKSNIILVGQDSGDKLDFINLMNYAVKKQNGQEAKVDEVTESSIDYRIKLSEHLYRFFETPSLPTSLEELMEDGPMNMDTIVFLLKEECTDFLEQLHDILLEFQNMVSFQEDHVK